MATRYAPRDYGHPGAPATSSDDSSTGPKSVRISPPSFPSFASPIAMSIPGSNRPDEPPPPLPPPRYVPIDGPTVFDPRFGGPGGRHEAFPEDRENRENYKLRDRPYDEGYHSIGSARTLNSPQFSMHNTYHPRPSADEYDSNMLNKLNNRRTVDNRSPTGSSNRLPALSSGRSPLSSSARDSTTNRPPPMQLPKLLSLPDRSRLHQPILESPHRYNQSPLGSAVSPRSGHYAQGQGPGFLGSVAGDYRSPLSTEITDFEGTSYPRSWRANSGSGSVRDDVTVVSTPGGGGNDAREDESDFVTEDTSSPYSMDLLTINDKVDKDRDRDRRQKRRASSPPDENVMPVGSEMFRRRDISRLTRGSPVPRLTPIPQSALSSTFSSLSSGGRSATTSYTSASSMTSMGSFGRRSPIGPSPVSPADNTVSPSGLSSKDYHRSNDNHQSSLTWARSNGNSPNGNPSMVPRQDEEGTRTPVWPSQAPSPGGLSALYAPVTSLPPSFGSQGVYVAAGVRTVDDTSRRSSLSWQGVQQQQQRTPVDVTPITRRDSGLSGLMSARKPGEELDSNRGSIAAKMQGFLMCECCPKKPKKFDSREALSAHEAEKQYQCSYCPNRFKNKNEAERHQNSLHLRRNSWSCSAMTSFEGAFHDSTTRPGEADTCGYCGLDFPRMGEFVSQGSKRTTHEDWEARAQHLQDVHKFRECNVTKKFWRADHFRQHLKHSHAGSSGKWTNILEGACMIDEEPLTTSR